MSYSKSFALSANEPIKTAAVILLVAQEKIGMAALMFKLNQTNKFRFIKGYIKPLMDLGWIRYTIPTKPNSSKQQYIITDQGRAFIEK